MPENITQIKLKFSCQQNWEKMKPVEGGRFCTGCNKTVYDFTNSKADEFRKIMAEMQVLVENIPVNKLHMHRFNYLHGESGSRRQ